MMMMTKVLLLLATPTVAACATGAEAAAGALAAPKRNPQLPQNFASGFTGALQDGHSLTGAGAAGTGSGVGTARP